MIEAPNMLMIGSAGRKSGKTELACSLIRKFRGRSPIIGLKVTSIHDRDGTCPRGGTGCGVCSSLAGDWCITEEENLGRGKDTEKLLAAGARKVYWLRVIRDRLEEGAAALLEKIGPNTLTICESNSLRTVVEPAIFLMVRHRDSERFKASAKAVQAHADRVVVSSGRDFDLDIDDVEIVGGNWAIRLDAAAIILAGGRSERMGRDKGMLPVDGRPMIEHVAMQLKPHFKQIIVSAGDAGRYAFLGLEVVADEAEGLGPLMGIASALKASPYDRNLVVACDIPQVNVAFVQRLLRETEGRDGVVPVTGGSGADRLIEPLFAVYRKGMLFAARAVLAEGKRKISDALDRCDIKYIELADAAWLRNLNTEREYEEFRSSRPQNERRTGDFATGF